MNRIVSWLAVALAAGALTACGGGGTTPTPGPCGSPSGVSQTVLAYPAPGSTGIPDAFGQVIVASTSSIPSGWGVTVTDAFGDAVNGNGFQAAPSPLPSPNASPSFANPVYQSSVMPSGTAYSGSAIAVYLNNLNSNCNPSVQIGSFTTQ